MKNPYQKKKRARWGGVGGRPRTCGYEGLGRCLAGEVRECERRADAFERAEVPEDHRGLAGSEAEDGLVGLAPLFVEQSCAGRRVWARWTLEGSHTHGFTLASASTFTFVLPQTRKNKTKRTGEATYAFVFFCDLDKAQLKNSFKKPSAPVYTLQCQRSAVSSTRIY
jgi:hypothetical protein